jgi:hypothetical protein
MPHFLVRRRAPLSQSRQHSHNFQDHDIRDSHGGFSWVIARAEKNLSSMLGNQHRPWLKCSCSDGGFADLEDWKNFYLTEHYCPVAIAVSRLFPKSEP